MANQHELPPPNPGESAGEYRKRVETIPLGVQIHHSIDPEKTKINTPLARAAVFAAALASAGYYVGVRMQQQTYEIGGIKAQVADLPKRADLADIERRITEGINNRNKSALVRCPKVVLRSQAYVDCPIIFDR